MRNLKITVYSFIAIALITVIYQAKAWSAIQVVISDEQVRNQVAELCENLGNQHNPEDPSPACEARKAACVQNVLDNFKERTEAVNAACANTGSGFETKCANTSDFRSILAAAGADIEIGIEAFCPTNTVSSPLEPANPANIVRIRCHALLDQLDQFPGNGSQVCEAKRSSCETDTLQLLNQSGPLSNIEQIQKIPEALNEIRRGIAEACTTVSAVVEPAPAVENNIDDKDFVATDLVTSGSCTLSGTTGGMSNLLGLLFLALPLLGFKKKRG